MIWSRLKNKHLFLTGGTGFFGRSLLEFVARQNEEQSLNLKITILTRSKDAFIKDWSKLADPRFVSFLEGNITDFKFPKGDFDSILHFATPANATWNLTHPFEMFELIVEGQKRVLQFAEAAKVNQVLLASSGAVYGKQPYDCTHVPESYLGAPVSTHPGSAYGEGKRVAEFLGMLHSKTHNYDFKIARCFTFVGPHLDPHGTFAMGNFIRDALLHKKIQTQGDGTSLRSYLYSDDLVLWLFKILLDGKPSTPYNVGSDQIVSIKELAETISKVLSPKLGQTIPIEILGKKTEGKPAERYVPSIELAKSELGLQVFTPLEQAIELTADRYRAQLLS